MLVCGLIKGRCALKVLLQAADLTGALQPYYWYGTTWKHSQRALPGYVSSDTALESRHLIW